MRLILDKFKILTDKKLEKPLKLVLISDLHFCKNPILFENININSLLRGLKKIRKIDFFVLNGDYVNSATDFLHTKTLQDFTNFLKKLTEIAPILMIRGNHDEYLKSKKSMEIYESFSKIEGVVFVDNMQIEKFGIKITGFAPSKATYRASKHGKAAQLLAKDEFFEQNFELNKEQFNLVLTHSPYCLSNKTMETLAPSFFEDADMILSGHMHNGLLPSRNSELINKVLTNKKSNSFLKRIIKKYADSGIWYVYKTVFLIRECRGARFFGKGDDDVILPSSKKFIKIDLANRIDETLQITTKGINKYAAIPFLVGKPSVVELIITPKK